MSFLKLSAVLAGLLVVSVSASADQVVSNDRWLLASYDTSDVGYKMQPVFLVTNKSPSGDVICHWKNAPFPC